MERVRCIEGLRTIGWIGVLVCHFKGAFLHDVYWWTDGTPLKFLYSGNEYVRLFFVISGFVTSYKYWNIDDNEVLSKDAIKRYFRLVPSVLVSEVVVCCLMKINLLKNAEVAVIVGSEDFLGRLNRFEPSVVSR